MRIFIAGATGAIGRPLVRQLIGDGHDVFGMTHSQERAHQIADLGACPVIADALDVSAIIQGIKKAQPEVIIDMLTALPKVYTPQAMREAAEWNRKVRCEGGSHLLTAAQMTGVRRYIAQSSAFWYASGPGLANEEASFAFDATPGIAVGTRIYADIEKRTFEVKNLEGVALRFGFFYGPGTWFASNGNMADQVRQQRVYIVGGGQGVWNFVHVEDAAKAVAAALSCMPGVYNITDDSPIKQAVWLPAYARWLGAPPPLERSSEEEEHINGLDSVYYATKLRGASNAKAKRELNFQPRPLEWLSI